MIFKIVNKKCPTCGHDCEGEPIYREAESLEKMWEKLKKPKIVSYLVDNGGPFDWEGSKSIAHSFSTDKMDVTIIKVIR